MRKSIYSIVIMTVFILTGCTLGKMVKLAKKQRLEVNPSPLELHGDSVQFQITGTLPVKMLKKNTMYTAGTSYKYGGEALYIGDLIFKGSEFPNASTKEPKVSKSFAFGYVDAMKRGDLVIDGKAAIVNGKSKKVPSAKVAEGIITTSRLVKETYQPAYVSSGYNDKEELTNSAVEFFFEQGKSNLRKSEIGSERGKFVDAYVAKKNITRTVAITGTHSPEGSETINTTLSNDRAKVIEKFFRDKTKKYDYGKKADSINFVLKPVVEDWAAFLSMLDENKKLSASQKEEIKAIINNGGGSFVEKEQQIAQLGSYKIVFKDIYPKLRIAKTEILFAKQKKSEAEISTVGKEIATGAGDASQLSDNELLHAAEITPDLKEKETIYLAAIKKNDSYAAHTNLAAVYIEQALKATSNDEKNQLLENAIMHLETANKIQESAEANSNMGVISLIRGDIAKGMDYIQRAASMASSGASQKVINGVKGALEIRAGKYDAAVMSLSNSTPTDDNAYNKGLAYVLKKDYTNAKTALQESISLNSNNAWAYYVSAIAAARMNEKSEVVAMLTKAVALNSDLKQRFVEDLEFKNFWNDQEVRDAVK